MFKQSFLFSKRNYSKNSVFNRYGIMISAVALLFMVRQDFALAQDIHTVILHTSVRNQIMDDITKEIFNRIGVSYTIEEYPWKRVLKNMEIGEGDGVPFIYFREERTEFLDYTDPVITSGLAVYVLADKQMPASFSSFSDLKPYTIGLVSGYSHCEAFRNAIAENELTIDYANNIDLNFKKLTGGRFDCFIESEILVAPLFRSGILDKTRFKTVPNEFCNDEFYFAFSKLSPAKAIIPKINNVIGDMNADGSMARLMGREE